MHCVQTWTKITGDWFHKRTQKIFVKWEESSSNVFLFPDASFTVLESCMHNNLGLSENQGKFSTYIGPHIFAEMRGTTGTAVTQEVSYENTIH